MLAKRTKRLFLLGVLLAGVLSAVAVASAPDIFLRHWRNTASGVLSAAGVVSALEIGGKAPDFTLPSTLGENISLSQFQGKKSLLIEFYGGDFDPT
jgi:cytochrome oxidase Cu insertion factor (SCO1/SenC/PrrC family)